MHTFKEAFEWNPRGKGNLFSRQKQGWYKDPRRVEKVFPPSEPGAKQRHMEKITQDSYDEAMKKLQHYTGVAPETATPMGLMTTILGAINQVTAKQEPHRKHLEDLALKLSLSLPEFKMFADLIKSGAIKMDAKLSKPSLKKAKKQEDDDEEEKEGNLEIEEIMADELSELDDAVIRRQFGRMMGQGNAVNKLYLYQMANEELNKMDPDLVKLYGTLSSIVHAFYYAGPALNITGEGEEDEEEDDELRDAMENAAVGSVQVIPNEDGTYTIKARSPFFPYLVHEIVKGFYDYLSMDLVSNEELAKETLPQEQIEIMSGPQLYKNFSVLIPSNKHHLMPMVYKLLLREPIPNMQAVIAGNEKGKSVINNLIAKAQQTMDEYEQSQEQGYEEPDYPPEEPEEFQ